MWSRRRFPQKWARGLLLHCHLITCGEMVAFIYHWAYYLTWTRVTENEQYCWYRVSAAMDVDVHFRLVLPQSNNMKSVHEIRACLAIPPYRIIFELSLNRVRNWFDDLMGGKVVYFLMWSRCRASGIAALPIQSVSLFDFPSWWLQHLQ